MSVIEDEKTGFWATILTLKDDERARVRLLDDKGATPFWTHQCRDIGGKFLDVMCSGSRLGCPLCETNNLPQFKDQDNKNKAYPYRKRYIKGVYVFGQGMIKVPAGTPEQPVNKVLLLIGLEVWKKIKEVEDSWGSAFDRDLMITRTRGDRVTYAAQGAAPSPFNVQITPEMIPSTEPYFEFLRTNLQRAVLIDVNQPLPAAAAAAPTAQPPVPVASPPAVTPLPATQLFVPAAPPAAQLPAAAPVPVVATPATPVPQPATPPPAAPAAPAPAMPAATTRKQQLLNQFTELTDKKLDGIKLAECMRGVAPTKSKLDQFTEEEMVNLITTYTQRVGLQPVQTQ